MEQNSCGCSAVTVMKKEKWMDAFLYLGEKAVPVVSTKLTFGDILAGWGVRWGIRRNKYRINPGLYSIGNPGPNSHVLVTANYKFTFDKLRKELDGLDVWLLVLDTRGVNVWCAAGKGTFGTRELIERILSSGLNEVVSHRKIILPQLGAVGVAAHKVKSFTRFEVVYGPVRAADIQEYLKKNLIKTEKMREVTFSLPERLAVVGIETVSALKWLAVVIAVLLVLRLLTGNLSMKAFLIDTIPFIGALIIGNLVFPILLPWIPFQAFSIKGFLLGLIWAAFLTFAFHYSLLTAVSIFMLTVPLISFIAMNFTGTSTFTSQTGAVLEVKIGTPIMIGSVILGLALNVLVRFNVLG